MVAHGIVGLICVRCEVFRPILLVSCEKLPEQAAAAMLPFLMMTVEQRKPCTAQYCTVPIWQLCPRALEIIHCCLQMRL